MSFRNRNSAPRQQLLSRRAVLGASAGLASLWGTTALSACSAGNGTASNGLVWGNWTYYLDFDEETQTYPTLERFISDTGIQVDYFEDIDDTNTFYAKIRDQLELDQFPGYDTFCFGDPVLARLIEKEQIQRLDLNAMPNVTANVLPHLREQAADPGLQYTVPWQSGMTGLCYNQKLYPKGVETIDDLLRPELHGKVGVLSEMTNTMGLVMLSQGVDIAGDWGDDEFQRGIDFLDAHLRSGQLSQVKGNSYVQDLQTGDTLAGMCWAGDISMLNDEAGEEVWKFVVPESGATYFVDSFMVPNGSEKRELVQQLIDYYYQPEIAAEVADYVRYVTPVAGAREAMTKINPELADNPLVFPDDETNSRLTQIRLLSSAEDKKYTTSFTKVLGL